MALLIPICVLISFKAIKFVVKEFLLCLLFIEELHRGHYSIRFSWVLYLI